MDDSWAVNNERAMLHSILKALSSLLLIFFVAACGGGEDPVEPEPERPPDLSGNYTLQSLASPILTLGVALTPPAVSGSFAVQQMSVTGPEATGTVMISVTIPDGQGGTTTIEDEGPYTNRLDGTWEQNGVLLQGKGTYTLQGSVLTVEVSEPALSVATTVWQKN